MDFHESQVAVGRRVRYLKGTWLDYLSLNDGDLGTIVNIRGSSFNQNHLVIEIDWDDQQHQRAWPWSVSFFLSSYKALELVDTPLNEWLDKYEVL